MQHAQNFRLRSGRHVADFVQKNRAFAALLEFADALHCGAGERAAFMAEEFALEQLFGNRGAIDRKKRLLAAVAVMINRAGDEFLAGAAFTGDERGGVAGGHLADELENLLHRLTAADDAQLVILGFEQGLVRHHLLHVARGLERVGDDFLELQRVERLEQIIVGAELHRLDGRLRRAVGGHQNDEELRIGGGGYAADPHKVQWQIETRNDPERRMAFCCDLIAEKINSTLKTLNEVIPDSVQAPVVDPAKRAFLWR